MRASIFLFSFLAMVVVYQPRPADADAGRLALVQADGSLRIGNRTVRLYGIHIPVTDRSCTTRLRPTRCGSRAALDLDSRLQGFVYCRFLGRNSDGSHNAFCEADCNTAAGRCREDLGARLISQGWAVAAPGAPFDYVVREKVARKHGRGIWGFQADSVIFR